MKYLIDLYEKIVSISKNSHPLDLESCEFICKIINENNLKKMLEIGTGLGFSSLYFALKSKIEKIISIEKNIDNFNFAKKQDKTNKITYLNEDAFKYVPSQKFDCIFIDGPKSHQIELLNNLKEYLNKNGIIIIDNIFLNRVKNKIQDKKTIKLLNKNEEFKNYLNNLNDYYVEFINIGDGLALLKRR